MSKLSVTIITLNEQNNIARCIESVKDLADEVIVVDSGSKDKTVDITEKLGAKVFIKSFENFADQKNKAADYAKGDWILSVDADEIIPKELAREIKESIDKNNFDGYLIPRRNFILGDEIKHSRWSPDKHIWLWRKTKGRWIGQVHEEVVVDGKVGILKNAKLHCQDNKLSDMILSNNNYSSILAKDLYDMGVSFSYLSFFWDPVFEFFIRYIYKAGFLDEARGFILCYIMAVYKLQVWVKVWERENLKINLK